MPQLSVGSEVAIHGLVESPEYNGMHGVIIVREGLLYRVKLAAGETLFNEKNLTLLHAAEHLGYFGSAPAAALAVAQPLVGHGGSARRILLVYGFTAGSDARVRSRVTNLIKAHGMPSHSG